MFSAHSLPWVTSLVAQMVKRLSTMWETWVRSLGREDSLEKETATHSGTLAQKIPWTEELGAGYCPWGRKESGTTERLHSLKPWKVKPRIGGNTVFQFSFAIVFFFFSPAAAEIVAISHSVKYLNKLSLTVVWWGRGGCWEGHGGERSFPLSTLYISVLFYLFFPPSRNLFFKVRKNPTRISF